MMELSKRKCQDDSKKKADGKSTVEVFTLWEEDNLEISVKEGFAFLKQRNFKRIRK